jgi:hypothetical protein
MLLTTTTSAHKAGTDSAVECSQKASIGSSLTSQPIFSHPDPWDGVQAPSQQTESGTREVIQLYRALPVQVTPQTNRSRLEVAMCWHGTSTMAVTDFVERQPRRWHGRASRRRQVTNKFLMLSGQSISKSSTLSNLLPQAQCGESKTFDNRRYVSSTKKMSWQ